jgi:asparagine synthase (glutamine-hydrolysing)
MCGIAGFVTSRSQANQLPVLRRMTQAIAHRGPDAESFWPAADAAPSHVWLGHRRLSIIDLEGGVQPMPNEDGSLQIIYNGEIFNHSDLRPELERNGHRYASHCDTETLIHSYEQFGPESLKYFRGMFAYVIWDSNRQELFCARDRLGIKPFYYYCDHSTFVFASEIKSVLEHPAVSVSPDEGGFAEYLAFWFRSDPEVTLFKGIRQLPPGHWLRLKVREGKVLEPEIVQYWDAPVSDSPLAISEAEAVEETYRRFEETVRMRLMSDVPLGMFLSGGVDSSAIAAMIRRITGGPLQTFSVGYAEQEYCELSWARQAAEHIGSNHAETRVSADDFFGALPDLVWQEDEPIAWPSSVSLYFVSKLAAKSVKVVLTGEGSDEIFAGYGRYAHYLSSESHARMWDMAPSGVQSALRGFIGSSSLLGPDLRRKLSHTVLGRPSGFNSMYLDNYLAAFGADDLKRITGTNGNSPYAAYLAHYQKHEGKSPLGRLLYADQKTYLAELLRKQDRMSMACSIESRVPLLDHTFVEYAASLPANLKLHGSTGKYIFKKMAEKLLPASIVHRPKMGFPTPISAWLQGTYRGRIEELLGAKDSFSRQVLRGTAGDDLLAQARSGKYDTTDRIWRLLTLELWGRRFFLSQKPALAAKQG